MWCCWGFFLRYGGLLAVAREALAGRLLALQVLRLAASPGPTLAGRTRRARTGTCRRACRCSVRSCCRAQSCTCLPSSAAPSRRARTCSSSRSCSFLVSRLYLSGGLRRASSWPGSAFLAARFLHGRKGTCLPSRTCPGVIIGYFFELRTELRLEEVERGLLGRLLGRPAALRHEAHV